MKNIIKFPSNFSGEDKKTDGSWLAGYAAGIADAKRGGADCFDLIRDSGLTIQDFIDAGADEYDINDIKELFENEGE